jgi:predicted lipoprotein with Yx(FWY)xxD motif
MKHAIRLVAGGAVLALTFVGCSGAATTPAPATPAPATSAPAASAPAGSASAAAVPTVVVTGGNAVEAKPVGSLGTVLVAGTNSMTVYTFAKDTANSGKSACTGGCLGKWPALTVATEAGAVGGAGVTGKLGTIKREDNGQFQVTYNGLPLYFFSGDSAPGDSNGVYANWMAVKP